MAMTKNQRMAWQVFVAVFIAACIGSLGIMSVDEVDVFGIFPDKMSEVIVDKVVVDKKLERSRSGGIRNARSKNLDVDIEIYAVSGEYFTISNLSDSGPVYLQEVVKEFLEYSSEVYSNSGLNALFTENGNYFTSEIEFPPANRFELITTSDKSTELIAITDLTSGEVLLDIEETFLADRFEMIGLLLLPFIYSIVYFIFGFKYLFPKIYKKHLKKYFSKKKKH